MDQRIEKHAHILLNYLVKLKKGEKIVILGQLVSYPLMKAIFRLKGISASAFRPFIREGKWKTFS